MSEFFHVTCLADGKRAMIRASSVVAVYEYGEEENPYGVKPAHTEISCGSETVDVVEGYDEVCSMIHNAEL